MEGAPGLQRKVAGMMKYVICLLHVTVSIVSLQRSKSDLVLYQCGFKYFFEGVLQIGFDVIDMFCAG